MSVRDLKEALALVEIKAIAPLARVYQGRPKELSGRAWQNWASRREEVEAHAAAALIAHGATVHRAFEVASVSLCGHVGASNMGLLTALKHWQKAAELALSSVSQAKRGR